ncbi:hypothetical protein [Serratia marcescens]|uniref:hypothetical protein n=1 Tax=Serratia marcescens TaxID=615 RepID=UPI003204DD70
MSNNGLPVTDVVGVSVTLGQRRTAGASAGDAYAQAAQGSAVSAANSAAKASQAELGAVEAADGVADNAVIASDAANKAEAAAESAQNIADANTYYTSPSDPDGTIAGIAGTPDGKMFRVAIQDGAGVTVSFNYYKNDAGTAIFINSDPSKRFVDATNETANLAMAGVDEFNSLRLYYTLNGNGKFPFYLGNGTDGALAIDRDRGAWFAGLQAAIQDYVNQLIPRAVGAYYKGLSHVITDITGKKALQYFDADNAAHFAGLSESLQAHVSQLIPRGQAVKYRDTAHIFTDETGKAGFGRINKKGEWFIPGVDGPLQDAIGKTSATIEMVNGKPALYWKGTKVWDDYYATSARPISESAALFTYEKEDGTNGSGLLFIPSIREIPVTAAFILCYICLGQSLGAAFDKPGQNIRVVGADPLLRGRCLSPSGRADGNSAPVSQTDLDRITDMGYNIDRQGHNIPLANGLMYEMRDAGMNLPTIINAPCNAGGQPLSGISKGTFAYTKSLAMVSRITELSRAIGKTLRADFILFEHGETDNDNGNCPTPGSYLSLLGPYFNDCLTDFNGITGATTGPIIVIDQVGSRINTKANDVDDEGNPIGDPIVVQPYSVTATDQLTYVRQHSNSIMCGTKYWLNWLYNDGSLSHLNQYGKVLQGEAIEKAAYWHLYDPAKKGTWKGTRVQSISVNGSVIDVKYYVPYPPLVIDTDFLGDCAGKGYSLESGSASVVSVEIVGSDIVRLTLNQAPSSTDHLLVGFTNTTPANNGSIYPLVCVHDSSPWVSRYITKNSNPVPIYNWATLDRIPLTGDF